MVSMFSVGRPVPFDPQAFPHPLLRKVWGTGYLTVKAPDCPTAKRSFDSTVRIVHAILLTTHAFLETPERFLISPAPGAGNDTRRPRGARRWIWHGWSKSDGRILKKHHQ
jgi:hypothetical protein